MIKEKKCKGHGKTKGYGCGVMTKVENRIYGLGKMCGCYSDWLLNSEPGKIVLAKAQITGSKIVKRKIQTENVKERKEKTIELMSDDKYRAKYLQPVINEIARIIDYGNPCIATGNYGKENGGHYISVGANRTICMNLHNLHIQSFESNHFRSGDTINYQNGIVKTYGEKYLDYMDGLKIHPPIRLRKAEMIELYKKACKIRNEIKKVQIFKSPSERIEMRNNINLELGIYNNEFCIFHQ